MSNKVVTPETKESGLYKVGELHVNGGIEVTVDSQKKIEVEVKEFKMCRNFWEDDTIYSYKNKTNLEVLDDLFQKNSCTFKTEVAQSNDFILCRLVVLDPKRYNRKGTVKDIMNQMQSEKSCNVTEDAKEEFKKEKGGEISNEKEFIKNEIDKHFNISGKYKEKGIGFMKGVREIYTDGIYASKNVLKPVQKDAEKLYYALNNGDVSKIKEIRDKYYSEWKKSHSFAGTQRDRFVRVDTSKIELYNTANAAMIYIDKINKEIKDGSKVELEHIDTLEKVSKGELSPKEGAVQISKDHIAEDPTYYEKLEEVENPFGRFIEIVKSSKDSKEAFEKAKKIKDVPQFVADEFSAKYNPDGKLSMEKAFQVFYDEYKNNNSDNQKEIDKLLEKKSNLESKLFEAKSSSNKVMNEIGFGAGMRRSKVSFSTSKEDEISNKIKVIDERIKELKGLNSKEIPNDEINKIIRDLSTMDSGLKDYDDSIYKSLYDKLLSSNEHAVLKEVKNYIQFQKDNAKYFTNEETKANADKWLESLIKLENSLIKDFNKSDDLEFKVTEQELPFKGNPNAKWVKVTYFGKDGETLMQGVAIDMYGSKEKAIEAAKEKIKTQLEKDKGKSKETEKQELQDLIDLLKEQLQENPDDQESKDALELYEETLKGMDSYAKGGSINRKLTYLGEVGGDRIGQKSSLEKAKSLEKQGISSDEIRKETGWFVNPYDKKLRFEISDEDFEILYNFEDVKKYFNENKNKTFFKTKLSDVIKNDKLFLAYPEFKNIPFYFYNEEKTTLAGVFIPENKEKEIFIIYNLYDEKRRIEKARGIRPIESENETWVSNILRISDIISGGSGLGYRRISNDVYKFRRNILAHELQHLIQIREEFGAGSSSDWWYEEIIRKRKINESELSKDERDNLRIESDLYYKNSSGEIESMDVDLRLDFNEKERKGIIPLSLVRVNPKYITVDLEEPRFEKGGELNAEESIINAPCINKKFKFVESSDYNEYRRGGGLKSCDWDKENASCNYACNRENNKCKNGGEVGIDKKSIFKEWKNLVNMSAKELKDFLETEDGKEAGLSKKEADDLGIHYGRESAKWIIKMKSTPVAEWTDEMWDWAKRQIAFIKRMSGNEGKLYDDKGNRTRKYTSLLVWGNDPEKYENGGSVSFDKIITASSRFKPTETVVFDPPLEGKNGAKLISYTWSYEWTMLPNYEGELKSKRVSDWSQAEISAETGRDIVHQYTILMPNGEYKTVSSDSVPVLLGYIDRKELKSFPNLVTASKTLAKQQMQLAILEAQKKEYDELYAKFEKAEKPEIKEVEETSKFSAAKESWEKGAYSNYAMGDIVYRQDNDYVYDTKEYKKRPITKDTIEQLTSFWISKRVEEAGGINPRGLYDLKNRVARQKRKVENILNTKMENGGEIEDFDWESLYNPSPEEEEKIKQEIKKSEEQEKEDWYQNTKFSKKWAATYKDAVNRTVKEYLDAKATYDDWASRQYKQNKGMVFLGGDDIFGEAKSIGSINEGRRQRVLRGAKMQMDESIETLKELRLTDAEINELLFDKKGTIFADGGKIEVNKVSVYQTNFSGLYFSDLGGYFDSNFTEVIDLEDKNIILKDLPIFLFFKNPYDIRYSEKIYIDDVIGAVIPKKMEKDARAIFDKRFISYVTYNDDANTEDKIEAIKKLSEINEDIILL